ncbi:hypothetical protein MKQ70_31785 [Chitinophaga sedimenti]|uniref:hypothetical protein n=1 Tax=Chitinophaga sedimenti TaxID=2033606 RepID=UPI002004AE36|nr:hypothetical protein [Chitinophaga sedimenti]MCK7559301.1 hypothetical protein [Chitinophaga sedimenti]
MKKSYLFYPLIIGVFGLLIWFIISKGELLQHDILPAVTELPVKPSPDTASCPNSAITCNNRWPCYWYRSY